MQDNNDFQNKPNNGYPQNIQMVPQGVNNQPQAYPQFLNQGNGFEQSESYGNVPPTVIQQGVVYQAVPVNAQYPNQGYPPHAFPSHPFPPQGPQYANYPVSNQMFGAYDQIHLINPCNQVFMIETKIKSDFCCYTCLVYYGLICSIIGVLGFLSAPRHPEEQIASTFIALGFLIGCCFAIKAKSTFDSRKQHQTYIVFCVITVLRLIIGLLFVKKTARQVVQVMTQMDEEYPQGGYNHNNQNDMDPTQIEEIFGGIMVFSILFAFLLDLLLVYFSHALKKLMKDRDQILINLNSTNRIV